MIINCTPNSGWSNGFVLGLDTFLVAAHIQTARHRIESLPTVSRRRQFWWKQFNAVEQLTIQLKRIRLKLTMPTLTLVAWRIKTKIRKLNKHKHSTSALVHYFNFPQNHVNYSDRQKSTFASHEIRTFGVICWPLCESRGSQEKTICVLWFCPNIFLDKRYAFESE